MSDNGQITWITETRRLGDLIPWEDNPRQLTEEQAERLERSLSKFGYSQLVEIEPDNTILDGHQRDDLMKVIDDYGPEVDVECRVSNRKFTLEERKEYIALKHQGATGEWNWEGMHNLYEFDELVDYGFDADHLEAYGFMQEEEPEDDPGAQIDRAEELREQWGVETGQLWRLGEHRLICGDCTDASMVERLMDGEKASMVFTDPPYNVAKESRNYAADKSKAMSDLKSAEWDQDFDVETLFPVLDRVMAKDCAVYICTSQWLVQRIWEWMWDWSDFCSYCIYCKPNPMPSLSKRHWTWATEMIPYAVRGKHISNFPDNGHALNWWGITKEKDTDHPTEKPLAVPERAIDFSSNESMIVFDGFLGSGTTLIACERLGRKCRAVEISPAYCAVAIQRWVDMTSGEPELVNNA